MKSLGPPGIFNETIWIGLGVSSLFLPAPCEQAMQDREQRREKLQVQLTRCEGLDHVQHLDRRRLERELYARLTDWQGLLTRHVSQTGQILGKLLVGRIRFTPKMEGGEKV